MKRSLFLATTLLCLSLVLSGCSNLSSALDEALSPSSASSSGATGASTTDDGREVGGYVDGRMGDTLSTAFFSYEVTDAYYADTFEGQSPSEGTTFVVAKVKIKNTFGDEIPMWANEFQIQWNDEGDFSLPIANFHESQMEDEYVMKKGETLEALCVFEVPVATEKTEYSVSYLEYYEDDVEGNVFFLYFDLDPTTKA
ncbi:DUF4352 domain-containing protein [Oscillospiraceae bacterium MB08-C2-2]|nr:DUF4352 domain-containing protein [Oscillospiraceae bacterium MB08-C2-2]